MNTFDLSLLSKTHCNGFIFSAIDQEVRRTSLVDTKRLLTSPSCVAKNKTAAR